MRRFARSLAKDLRGRLEQAIGLGAFAVVAMAFLAVVREGLETALLFYAAAPGRRPPPPVRCSASAAGVLTAVALGWLHLRRRGPDQPRPSSSRWTGLLLILVAAGIFKYGVHDFQEAGVLPGLTTYAFDISGWYDPSSWYARAARRHVQLHRPARPCSRSIAWVAYAVPVLVLFLAARGAAPAAPPCHPGTSAPVDDAGLDPP